LGIHKYQTDDDTGGIYFSLEKHGTDGRIPSIKRYTFRIHRTDLLYACQAWHGHGHGDMQIPAFRLSFFFWFYVVMS
jgi:hypothetical protein